ncbi:DoxX family protein [Tabrizicola sp.]|uniref:DoxX family protein n=1 Tax=Tabrizicola sp. TaxID=2005166 RepID=UPI002732AF54|nr:hypothetical protein [Tabrizicola sp.]MDP3195010.1 hypothetical protein [Tabrizicola sp.]
MTKARLLSCVTTVPRCLMYLAAAGVYLSQREMVAQGFVASGVPAHLIPVLIVAKIAAPIAIPSRLSVRLSDLAYARMFYHLLLALSAHLNAGNGGSLPAVLAFALMPTSFFTRNAARRPLSPNVPTGSCLPGKAGRASP